MLNSVAIYVKDNTDLPAETSVLHIHDRQPAVLIQDAGNPLDFQRTFEQGIEQSRLLAVFYKNAAELADCAFFDEARSPEHRH